MPLSETQTCTFSFCLFIADMGSLGITQPGLQLVNLWCFPSASQVQDLNPRSFLFFCSKKRQVFVLFWFWFCFCFPADNIGPTKQLSQKRYLSPSPTTLSSILGDPHDRRGELTLPCSPASAHECWCKTTVNQNNSHYK